MNRIFKAVWNEALGARANLTLSGAGTLKIQQHRGRQRGAGGQWWRRQSGRAGYCNGSDSAEGKRGGKIKATGNSVLDTRAATAVGAHGIEAFGTGSEVNLPGASNSIFTAGQGPTSSHGVLASGGAKVVLGGNSNRIATEANSSIGLNAQAASSVAATIASNQTTLTTQGSPSHGLFASSDSGVVRSITLTGDSGIRTGDANAVNGLILGKGAIGVYAMGGSRIDLRRAISGTLV